MIQSHIHRTLLVTAALLMVSGAFAQSPNANPHAKEHAADPAKVATQPGAKPEDHKGKPDEKKPEAKADEKAKADKDGKGPAERAARKAKEHEAQKAKLSGLKRPIDAALKQELRRHAERIARLERIKSIATEAKDTDAIDRATKLLAKENARHDKWVNRHASAPPTQPAAPAPAQKEGAK